VYTAPSTPGSHTVTGTDTVTHQSYSSKVTVYSKVAVDFGGRSNALHVVPPYMFGAEHLDSLNTQADRDMVARAGITYARFYSNIPLVFPTKASVSAPLWNKVDFHFQQIGQATGMHIMVQLLQSPPWLVPTGACHTSGAAAMPTDVNAWANLAALYVAHLDQKFPTLQFDYEIWNEPNTGALCSPTGNQLADYQKLYAAASAAMKTQAAKDGKTIRIGGPGTAGLQKTWIQALLSNPATYPRVDFVSYHSYLFSNKELNAKWDTYNGVQSVVDRTQDSGIDPRNTYLFASQTVAAGKQPNAANTPIFNTEYNMNWQFALNCCSNNPTFAPIWNSLFVADLLNTVYGGAHNVPGHIVYFGATAGKQPGCTAATCPRYFCLLGTIDAAMDCPYAPTGTPQAYPQYYAYQLIAATPYLGLQNGGHMAASISSPPVSAGAGLVVSAFFNSTQDSILIINPTSQAFPSLTVSATNTGYTATNGTLYQIVNGQQIRSAPITLTQSGTAITTHLAVPAYSVQAISIKSK
jgi:hypothetical protein